MMWWSRIRIAYGEGRLTHDEDRDKHLCPVNLVCRLKGSDQLADEERQHGYHDGEGHGGVREHEACCTSGEQTTDHGGNEFCRDE